MSRYYVSELEGFIGPNIGGRDTPGMSYMVIDSLVYKQVMATYRTEDHPSMNMARWLTREETRARAAEHCARLNAEAA